MRMTSYGLQPLHAVAEGEALRKWLIYNKNKTVWHHTRASDQATHTTLTVMLNGMLVPRKFSVPSILSLILIYTIVNRGVAWDFEDVRTRINFS